MKNIIHCQIKQLSVWPLFAETETDIGKQQPLLQNIDLDIHQGDWIQLYGKNGSGKSTLLKVLAGSKQYKTSGEISYIRNENGNLAEEKMIPIVLQQPAAGFTGATAWEDAVLLLEQHRKPQELIIPLAEQMLEKMGMSKLMHRPLEQLSGGQQQMAAISGALAVSKDMLILDEVTAMLDEQASKKVLHQLRQLSDDKVTVVWATQKAEEIRYGDRIVVLEHGSKIFDGSASEWFKRNGDGAGSSACEQLGFDAPRLVQVCWQLEEAGITLPQLPIGEEELVAWLASVEAVMDND